jgi:hypothetical protein
MSPHYFTAQKSTTMLESAKQVDPIFVMEAYNQIKSPCKEEEKIGTFMEVF